MLSRVAVLLWLANVVLDTGGHLAFKSAALIQGTSELARWKSMVRAPVFWLGIACFCLEFVAWLGLLSLIPLSLAILIGSIDIVAVMVAGRLFFREQLDFLRVAGMSLIAVGVALSGGFL